MRGVASGSRWPGAAVVYELYVWPDVLEHDLATGTYAVSGTRLQWIPYEVPGEPQNVTVTAGSGLALIEWDTIAGVEWWRVEWGFTLGGPYTAHVVVPGETLAYLATVDVPDGTDVYARVRGGIGYGGLQNLTLGEAFAAVGPRDTLLASAVWNIGFDAGTGLGAVVVGAIAAGSSFPVALLVAAACSLATLPLALMRTRRSVG